MALHHRQHVENMRGAFDSRSRRSQSSDGSDSIGSYKSDFTQPTNYSTSPAKQPLHVHYNTYDEGSNEQSQRFFGDQQLHESPRASVETYASTVESEEDLAEEEIPEYDPPEYTARPYESTVLAATPADFSELFPSRRRLFVRHDDSTLDGNMNLRVDTEITANDRRCDISLFHLRMHDLKQREFSLRRYCRDSGREVCHSSRKQQKAKSNDRPLFQRSWSNALSSIRPKSEIRAPTLESLKRNDSGYGSLHSTDLDEDARPRSAGVGAAQSSPSNDTVKLEFSNYAQVDVRKMGRKGNRRYEFEYWGTTYFWKRSVKKDKGVKEVSFRLTKSGHEHVLAYITPLSLSRARVEEEQSKGGWVAPCSMQLADESLTHGQKDAVDVIIASGLIALVDDAIRARFQSKTSRFVQIPNMQQLGVEYIGPKRLINEIFRRDSDSNQQSRPPSSRRPTTGASSTTGSRPPAATVRQSSY